MRHIKRHLKLIWPHCQPHILEKIIIGAFISINTPGKIIKELQKQYPDYYEAHYSEND